MTDEKKDKKPVKKKVATKKKPAKKVTAKKPAAKKPVKKKVAAKKKAAAAKKISKKKAKPSNASEMVLQVSAELKDAIEKLNFKIDEATEAANNIRKKIAEHGGDQIVVDDMTANINRLMGMRVKLNRYLDNLNQTLTSDTAENQMVKILGSMADIMKIISNTDGAIKK